MSPASHEAPAIVSAQPRGALAQLRSIASLGVVWRTWIALAVLVLLATSVNVPSLATHATAGAALDAFTAVNASVFFALLLGVIVSSEYPPRLIGSVVGRRRALGAHGRSAGLAGLITALVFGALAAAVALPLLHARGMPAPRIGSIVGYVDREAIAAARLAMLGVAIGAVLRRRRVGLLVLVAFLLADWILESVSSFIRDYGPVSAINAFSDPPTATCSQREPPARSQSRGRSSPSSPRVSSSIRTSEPSKSSPAQTSAPTIRPPVSVEARVGLRDLRHQQRSLA